MIERSRSRYCGTASPSKRHGMGTGWLMTWDLRKIVGRGWWT